MCGDEAKLKKFLESYGVLRDKSVCECGGSFGEVCQNGNGRLKTFLRSRGGVYSDQLEDNMKEFQWRRNLPNGADSFITLLCCIRDGYLQ